MPRRAGLLLLPLLLGACSPLRSFDALVPKDGGVVRSADLAFGPDQRQRLDVYASAAAAGSARPVIVFLYGGSWSSGTKDGYRFAGRAFAARGFVTVVPDYRLVPAVRYPAFLEDNAAAVRWTRANIARFGGDPDRLVLVGHSAGAYNAAMLALDRRWLGSDRAAVRGFVGLAGPYDFLPLDGPVTQAAFGRADDLPATQPVNQARADAPPALLLTGDADTTVRPRNSRVLAERLRAAGADAEVRTYPGVGHVGILTALARPFRARAPVLDDAAAFARRVTASRERPASGARAATHGAWLERQGGQARAGCRKEMP